ncbi:acyl-CoA dehydrogenase family protein [Pararoseomonas indoligenes]|uniref:Acyl-CoA/acyl-ACP dehydrogenase n=1 Tax=Roseomonas indoligenes TaxID=2820811 RepID=A0A940SAF7_9PROT|nr:acyl-CoA dehydrogenase family protein [Pararoseomonas indoligenes]MBP0496318.1 acyl-CoA/acyl-ACP dehydrogenase [Pararoseomonas indoligenes]
MQRIASAAARHDANAEFPSTNLAALHSAGMLDLTVPCRFGGQGRGLAAAARLLGMVGGACASTGLILAMQLSRHAALAREGRWPKAVHARVARDAVQHGALLNALRAEPDLGSPTRGGLPASTLRAQPDGTWSLSGRKTYVTGAPGLTWMEVWVRTAEERPRLGYALVRADMPGVRIVESWDQLGMRATGSHDVVFEDVVLPAEHAVDLRAAEDWAAADPAQAVWNAIGLGALYNGIGHTARNWIVHFLHDRRPTSLGAPLASLPRMQEKVGEIQSLLLVNDRLIASVAADTDASGPPSVADSLLLKTILTENAVRAVELAAALAGNHAYARANPLERHLRDVLCARIHVPTADAAHVAAGREALAA